MTPRFDERLARAWPVSSWGRVPVVVAVSGGADSVALLRGLVSLADADRSMLVVAHFDHRLRPDSQGDANFVSDLSRKLQVQLELGVASEELAAGRSGSIEDAARDSRYAFLTEIARRVGARFVATAHTADDQAETILHRIVRGTGIRGLAGIPTSRELVAGITLVRPLLEFRRTEIVEYLNELGQPFRQDATNSDERFTRNRIRNALLPALRDEYNPHVDESLRRLGALAGEMSDYVESVAGEHVARCVQFFPDGVTIELGQLAALPPLIVRTMLRQVWRTQGWSEREMTFERWHELEQFARSSAAAAGSVITLPANIRVERVATQLAIKKQGQP